MEESMFCDENGKPFLRTNKFDMEFYNKKLEEQAEERNCVNCSNHGKQFEVMKLEKEIAELKELVNKQTSELMTRFFKIKRLNEKTSVLEKENAELKAVCDYNCPDHKLATHNACLLCPAIRNSPHHDLKNMSDEELEIIIKNAEIEMEM